MPTILAWYEYRCTLAAEEQMEHAPELAWASRLGLHADRVAGIYAHPQSEC